MYYQWRSYLIRKSPLRTRLIRYIWGDSMSVFWGELIDKYKDMNANSKTVFTDYAMLKLVLYSPHMFLLFCQSKVGVVKKILGRSVSYKNDHDVFHIKMIM